MGWLWKTMGVIVALMLIGAGVWGIGLLIFALIVVPPILRSWAHRGSQEKVEGGRPRGRFPARHILGGLLLLLAIGAYASQGTFSPLVLGSLGVIVLFWGRIPIPSARTGFRAVDESVLLRSSPFPVGWAAIAQVKPITRDLGRALSGVNGTLLVAASETTAVYLLVESRAFNERSAEEEIVGALKESAMALSSLGAYLVPLDSKDAVALLRPSLERREGGNEWSVAVASGGYDLLVIKQDGGFARSLEFFKRTDEGQEGRARIPVSGRRLAHPPFLTEVYKAIGGRVAWPQPDQMTAFLSSLLATSGEPIGTRVVETGKGSQSEMVLVKSQGSPPVELSRAQLRAVVRMYDRGAS